MGPRISIKTTVVVGMLLLGAGLALWGCGAEPGSTTSEAVPASTTVASTKASAVLSFEEAWAASLAELEALGPTRVTMTETIAGQVQAPGATSPEAGPAQQTTQAEQLLDFARERARLTVHDSDGSITTTVVNGRERTSTRSDSLTSARLVSASRYVSLEAPEGLAIPLWAGNAVGPTQGYPDLLTVASIDPGSQPSEGTVEKIKDGSTKLSWERTTKGVTSAVKVALNPDLLPTRIEMKSQGTPTEGELQGARLEYSLIIEYRYEKVASLADSDFVLDVPADAYREGVTYELSLPRPWSEQADWGQYWLGQAVGQWKLIRAEYALHGDSPELGSGAEPRDEGVFLIYERPDKASPNENIQMIVRPLEGRYFEDSRKFAEQRVASGDWVRQEKTLAGQPATLYSGSLEGGADSHIDSIYVFLPDAFVNIQVSAPVDPLLVLEALSPVE